MSSTRCRRCGVQGTLAGDGYCPKHTRVDGPTDEERAAADELSRMWQEDELISGKVEVKVWQVEDQREKFELVSQYVDRNVRLELYGETDSPEGVIVSIADCWQLAGLDHRHALVVLRKPRLADQWVLIDNIQTLTVGW